MWQHLCQPRAHWHLLANLCGTKGLVSSYWDLHSVPGTEGMAAGRMGLKEWSRV